MRLSFTVPGEPKGKARAQTVRNENGASHTYTPDNTVLYENLIKTIYRQSCPGRRFPDDAMLDMRIIAYYGIPKSKSKKQRVEMLAGNIRPTKTPDWDNIGKVVSDALNNIAYADDRHIVDAQVRKFYSDRPRVEVIIQTIEGGSQ